MTNYHLINGIDDALDVVINLPKHCLSLFKAPSESWGLTIEKLVRISVLTIVLIGVVTLDVAQFMYQAGHAFGQSVHSLNNTIANITRRVVLKYSKDELYYSLDSTDNTSCVVRKSTQTQPVINSWQLQLPFPALINFVHGSSATTTTVNTKESPLSWPSTKHGPVTEDLKKGDGITKPEPLSKASASSPRSKRSVRRLSSSSTQKKSTEATLTTLDGHVGESASSRDGLRSTQRNGPTTAKKQQQ